MAVAKSFGVYHHFSKKTHKKEHSEVFPLKKKTNDVSTVCYCVVHMLDFPNLILGTQPSFSSLRPVAIYRYGFCIFDSTEPNFRYTVIFFEFSTP